MAGGLAAAVLTAYGRGPPPPPLRLGEVRACHQRRPPGCAPNPKRLPPPRGQGKEEGGRGGRRPHPSDGKRGGVAAAAACHSGCSPCCFAAAPTGLRKEAREGAALGPPLVRAARAGRARCFLPAVRLTPRPMWGFLLLLLLCVSPPPGSAMPPPPPQNESGADLQSPGPSPASPATPTLLPSHSEAPALRLNLGLNFQVKVRSQGKGQPPEGPGRAATRPPPPRGQPDAPAHSPTEAAGGSAGAGSAGEPLAGPTAGPNNGSSSPRAPAAPRPSATPLRPGEHSSELEFQVDIGLSAGLGQERGSVLGGGGGGSLLPVLADALGMAGQGGGPGLFGFTLPPELWKPQEWNVTGSPVEEPEDPVSTAEGTLEPGPVEPSGSPTAPLGSEEAFVALPACLPDRPDACGSPRPEPGTPQLLPGGPLFVPLHSDWTAALATWGPAWEGHVYGAGALFALLAALALLALLVLPCRRHRLAASEGRLLGLLHLLLLGAGSARAGLLFGQADGQRWERLPALAVRLLRDLPLPCLTSALAAALLLLSRRPRAKLSAHPGLRPPCLLVLLLLGHFSAATGAVLAAERLPVLLLASRGLFALLAALLSAALLGCSCLARGEVAQIYDLRSAPPPPTCQGSFASGRRWSRAARAASPAATFGLLSAGLHAYSVLHVLGYGLSPALFGPWPWWALQLSCRLCEAGVGLPLAAFGLYLTCGCSAATCCRRLTFCSGQAAAKAPVLPSSLHWALSQQEKLAVCSDTVVRSQSDYLPLCAVSMEGPLDARCAAAAWSVLSLAVEAADPTADFQPPSPIDLRRSIDEALSSEGLLQGSSAFSTSSILSLVSATECHLPHATSCLELALVQPQDDGLVALQPHGATIQPSSPTSPTRSTAGPSPSHADSLPSSPAARDPPGGLPEHSQESLASVGQPREDTAPMQEEPVDVSQPADVVSVGSDTIDL
ncbi:proline-rich transmembrane protein 4 [Ahaetulla prasina]|uniref:proline-rich transmembrane protein 4 n=1 Tax=Ahaetulla prasina TaxID=499056 RepID=UPI0026495DAE|nr:proline-rich transmembrane protein 4 [Ahaetulla prasina]